MCNKNEITATISEKCDLHGESKEDMASMLDYNLKMIIGCGALTGASMAEVIDHDVTVSASGDSESAEIKAIINIKYELYGEQITDLANVVEYNIHTMIGNGGLTGETMAEIDEYTVDVEVK